MSTATSVKIYYSKDETGPAIPLGGGEFRIDSMPILHRTLCLGDVVRLSNTEPFPRVRKVVRRQYEGKCFVWFSEGEVDAIKEIDRRIDSGEVDAIAVPGVPPKADQPGFFVLASNGIKPKALARECGFRSRLGK